MARAKDQRNGRLEEALATLVQNQAILVQNQASFLARMSEIDKRFSEIDRWGLSYSPHVEVDTSGAPRPPVQRPAW